MIVSSYNGHILGTAVLKGRLKLEMNDKYIKDNLAHSWSVCRIFCIFLKQSLVEILQRTPGLGYVRQCGLPCSRGHVPLCGCQRILPSRANSCCCWCQHVGCGLSHILTALWPHCRNIPIISCWSVLLSSGKQLRGWGSYSLSQCLTNSRAEQTRDISQTIHTHTYTTVSASSFFFRVAYQVPCSVLMRSKNSEIAVHKWGSPVYRIALVLIKALQKGQDMDSSNSWL